MPCLWPRAKEVPVLGKAWVEQQLAWAAKQEALPANGYRFLVGLKARRRKYGPVVFGNAIREAHQRVIIRIEPFQHLCERLAAD